MALGGSRRHLPTPPVQPALTLAGSRLSHATELLLTVCFLHNQTTLVPFFRISSNLYNHIMIFIVSLVHICT